MTTPNKSPQPSQEGATLGSSTPRTDAHLSKLRSIHQIHYDIWVETLFARELERELAQAKAELEISQRDCGLLTATLHLSAHQLGCDDHMVDHAVKTMLAKLAEQSAALAACKKLLSSFEFRGDAEEQWIYCWPTKEQVDSYLAQIEALAGGKDSQ